MNKSAVTWLYGELPGLVAKGILTDDDAARVRAHYGGVSETSSKRAWALAVSGVLGSLLIGLGITLVVAHNWPDLSRSVRVAIAFTPLLVGQLAGAYTVVFRRDSVAWRESSGAFIVMALATCIALIGQTYHMPGNLEGFLFTCMVLAVPLAYLLNSTMVAVLFLCALPFWTGMHLDISDGTFAYLPMALLIAPYVIWSIWRRPSGLQAINLALFGSASFAIGINMSVAPALEQVGFLLNTALATAFYLAHLAYDEERPASWTAPLRICGAIAQIVFAIILTFGNIWRNISDSFRFFPSDNWVSGLLAWAVIVLLLAVCAALLARALFQGRYWKLVPGSLPILTLLALVYTKATGDTILPVILFNVFILVLGIAAIAYGVQEDRLLVVNWGILLVSALITARFFDSDLPFVVRGLAFIGLGIAFLATNVFWLGRKRRAPEVTA